MYSFKTLDCLCCGRVYPLKYIYVSPEIPAICDSCISKIIEAYDAYLNDDALDELECLLKWFNTPTEIKVTINSMKSIYNGNASPLLTEEELLLEDNLIVLTHDQMEESVLNNDIDRSILKEILISPSSTESASAITMKCSSSDYQAIAVEAAKLMKARKNRPMRTAITMAWKKFAVQKLKELQPDASRILIERPDDYTMSIVVEDILESGTLDQVQK